MANVLVTGGAGYIGQAVVHRLLIAGHTVTVLDNLKYGWPDDVPREAKLLTEDLLDADLPAVLGDHRIEVVCHLAAESLIPLSSREPDLFWRVNVIGGARLLRACAESSVRQFVYASTSSVYRASEHRLNESSPLGPCSVYGETKLKFERLLSSGCTFSHWAAFRFFNVIGETDHCREREYHKTRLVPMALKAAAGEIPFLLLYGTDYPTRDGTCERDYLHVEDVAEAFALAVDGNGGVTIGVMNLGTGSGWTNREVVEAVQRVTGATFSVEPQPRRRGDPPSLVADADRARELLGWTPKWTGLDDMIRSVWQRREA